MGAHLNLLTVYWVYRHIWFLRRNAKIPSNKKQGGIFDIYSFVLPKRRHK